MAIGIRDEHDELRLSVKRWIESRCPPEVTRAALDAEADRLPDFWADLGAQGTLGIHLPEEFGGQGAGMTELAVVAEELGRAAAPGPWAGTAVVGAVVAEWGSPTQAKELLPVLADGTLPASLVVPAAGPDGSAVPRVGLTGRSGDDGLTVDGTIGPIPNGGVVGAVLAPVEVDGEVRWVLLDREESVRVESRTSFDPSRRSADWVVDGTVVPPERLLEGATAEGIRELALLVASAEAVGGARWCLDTAAEHARTRHQFGRPIGQFQGVKHRLADMLVMVEQGVAATWDAALSLDAGPMGDRQPGGEGETADAGAQTRLAVALAAGSGPGRLRRGGEGGHPGPRGDGLHLGARRPHPPAPGHHPPPAGGGHGAVAGGVGQAGPGRPAAHGDRRAPARGGGAPGRADRGGRRHRRHRGSRSSSAGPWPTRVCCPRTGPHPGGGTPVPSNSWSSTRSVPRPDCADRTWPWPPGPCPPSWPTGPRSRPSGGWARPSAASCSGASCSANPGPVPTWPRSPPGPPGSTGAGSSTARRYGRRWRPAPTWGSAWPAPTPTSPSTGASPTSWWT